MANRVGRDKQKPGGRVRKKPEPELLSISDDDGDDEVPAALVTRDQTSDLLIYEYVPNDQVGDVFVGTPERDCEFFALKCRGCYKEFDADSQEKRRRVIRHCIQDCKKYQKLGLTIACPLCNKMCVDAAALIKHQTATGTSCPSNRPSPLKPEAKRVNDVLPGPSPRKTSIETVRAPADPPEAEVITIRDTAPDPSIPRLQGICYEYVPDESFGDVVTWSGTSVTVVSATCKGCATSFPTLVPRDQVIYVNHCVTECEAYKSRNMIVYCYPCRLNCMDQKAFMEHAVNTSDCPAHPYLKFKAVRNTATSARSQNGRSKATEAIQLD